VLEQHFKEHSVAQFFKKNKQMLGFSGKVRSLTTIIHEYVTNSLDAAEEAGILPDVVVELQNVEADVIRVKVSDNGPGLPKHLIGKAFGQMLAGTKFHRYVQQRGQQGIGAAGCTMFSLLTTGRGVIVTSHYNNTFVKAEVSIDFKTNKPVVVVLDEGESNKHGITVEGVFGDVKYDKGKYGVFEYLKRSALSNPHASFTLIEPDGNVVLFNRSTFSLPPKPKEVKPHPLGVSAHDLLEMAQAERSYHTVSSFLQARLARMSAQKVKELEQLVSFSFKISPNALTWAECEELVKAFKRVKWMAPALDSVQPIGRERIVSSFSSLLQPQFLHVVERGAKVFRGGIPFMVEVAIAYDVPSVKKGVIMRYANRVPLLFDAGGCAITQVVKNTDWKRYGVKDFDNESIVVLVNVSSVHVPYTGAGKQAIADEEEIVKELRNALNQAGRALSRYISGVIRAKERENKVKAIKRYVGELAHDLSQLSGESEELLKRYLLQLIEQKYLGGSDGKSVG
jgi:DNA topoisomerase-6 subunit B